MPMKWESVKYHKDKIKELKAKIERMKELIKYHKAKVKDIKSRYPQ